MHQRAARAAVAVDERMNRLELGMSDRGLSDRRQRIVVTKGAEVFDEVGDLFWWRRDERSGAWVEVTPADPVLHRAQATAMRFQACAGEEAREHYVSDGVLVSLGYALAMNDSAASVVAGGVSTVSAADRGNVIALFEKQAA